MMNKKILVAAALPYANGPLHLGHVAALLSSDIFARYHRLAGNDVLFVSGSDCHGTPIAVEADRLKISPSEIAEKYDAEFRDNLINGLSFSYDNFTKTTSKTHEAVVQDMFLKLYNKKLIYTKTEDLPYCPKDERFLPDRYIEGTCPQCGFKDARGDQCDQCGKMLDPKDLIDPRCKICGTAPVWRPTEHFYLKLTELQKPLEEWVKKSEGWRINAKAFAEKFLEQGLQDRAITRDTEWGVKIPLPGYETKRIYVWFEAVCGYLSASKEWAENSDKPDAWKDFWLNDEAEHAYFHGKDNIPFHTIIWPAILLGVGEGLHLPDKIYATEYLTLEKKQFSKSRHWAVWLKDFLKDFDSDTLRFYLTLSGPENGDTDFSWIDYRSHTNNELIGNFGNFIHRTLHLVKSNFPEGIKFPGVLSNESTVFLDFTQESFDNIGRNIESGHFKEAIKQLLMIVENGNRYLDTAEPWKTIKTEPQKAEEALAVASQVIRCLAILASPFLPRSMETLKKQVQDEILSWVYPEPKKVFVPGEFSPLYKKIEIEEVETQKAKLGKED